jgi:hypothetical protein
VLKKGFVILWRLFVITTLGLALCPLGKAANLAVADCTRIGWRLEANRENPAGPGRWIRSPIANSQENPNQSRSKVVQFSALRSLRPIAVRAGERVMLDEQHGRVSYSLVGRALGSARVGEPLRMQLLGRNAPLLTVIAIGEGRVGFPVQTSTAGAR